MGLLIYLEAHSEVREHDLEGERRAQPPLPGEALEDLEDNGVWSSGLEFGAPDEVFSHSSSFSSFWGSEEQ